MFLPRMRNRCPREGTSKISQGKIEVKVKCQKVLASLDSHMVWSKYNVFFLLDDKDRNVFLISFIFFQWLQILISVNHLLIAINSAFNFLFYLSYCWGKNHKRNGEGKINLQIFDSNRVQSYQNNLL